MYKTKFQRVISATGGIRHRMIYKDDNGKTFIKTAKATGLNNRFILVTHIKSDLYKVI